jgi:hypothetical protein
VPALSWIRSLVRTLSRGGVHRCRAGLRWRPQVDLRRLSAGEPRRAAASGGGPQPFPEHVVFDDGGSSTGVPYGHSQQLRRRAAMSDCCS